MADASLTQTEADALLALEKRRSDDTQWDYPSLSGVVTIPLLSMDSREEFLLDIRRSRINFAKGTYQNRGQKIVIPCPLGFRRCASS